MNHDSGFNGPDRQAHEGMGSLQEGRGVMLAVKEGRESLFLVDVKQVIRSRAPVFERFRK